MTRDFLFDATPDFELRGSRMLSAADAEAMAADAAAKANAGETRPVYQRHFTIPTHRFERWEWWVSVVVGGERETVVGPNRAWTRRAMDRRSYRAECRLIREAAER